MCFLLQRLLFYRSVINHSDKIMAVSKIFEAIFHNNEELFMDMLKRGCANAALRI